MLSCVGILATEITKTKDTSSIRVLSQEALWPFLRIFHFNIIWPAHLVCQKVSAMWHWLHSQSVRTLVSMQHVFITVSLAGPKGSPQESATNNDTPLSEHALIARFGACSSEMLRSVALQLVTDVSGQRKCPIFKVQVCAETSITTYQPKPCNIPEKGIYFYWSNIILFNDTELVR